MNIYIYKNQRKKPTNSINTVTQPFNKQGKQQRPYQQGVALITAMIITAIAVAIAATLVSRQQVSIHLAGNISALEQAYQYTLAIEEWAGVILKQDLKDNDIDSCDDTWATEIPPIPIPGGSIEGKLYDLQALININNVMGDKNERGEQVVNENSVKQLKSLFSTLELTNQLELSDTILDWIDEDDRDRSSLAENSYYKSLNPPYLAANGPLISLSELRTIKGFNEKATTESEQNNSNSKEEEEAITVYQKVRPYLTALPNPSISKNTLSLPSPPAPATNPVNTNNQPNQTNQPANLKRTAINVNTAPEEVLLSIQGITEGQINNIIEDRKGSPFETVDEFITSVGGNAGNNPIEKTSLDVRSSYFLLKGTIQINNVRLFINSVLFRDENNKKVHVISREFNEISQDEIIDTCAANNEIGNDNINDDINDDIDNITP